MSVVQEKYKQQFLQDGMEEECAESYSGLASSAVDKGRENNFLAEKSSFIKRLNGMVDGNHEAFIKLLNDGSKKLDILHEDIFNRVEDFSLLQDLAEKHDRECDLELNNNVRGYRLNSYRSIERKLDGINNGIQIYAADPNVGKSATLSSLAIDLLRSNSTPKILFYTIDDEKSEIYDRMLAICSDRPINVVNRKRNKMDEEAVQKAYCELIGYGNAKRLFIYDSQSFKNAKQLCSHISKVREELDNLIVFIDGVTNLSVEGKTLEERGTNMALMLHNVWKPTATSSGFPLIISNELKKRDAGRKPKKSDIKGSTKWEFVAKCVFLLYAEDEDDFNNKKNMNVIFNLDKNKFSHHKGAMAMEFKPERSMFVDSEWN